MSDFGRYAIYHAPPAGDLADFGAAWLGWDAQAGRVEAHPSNGGLPLPVAELTATPRKYGFHGTLKSPFRPRVAATQLEAAVARFARTAAPFDAPPLRLSRIGGFLALTPSGSSPALAAFAGRCVQALDPFRKALTPADLARRRAADLSPRQDAYLARWGYPYVLDEFRFHMTLTGRLPADLIDEVERSLSDMLSPMLGSPLQVKDLCLFGEAADGRFYLVRRFPLGG